MPIENPNPTVSGSAPVVIKTALGQRFRGVICKFPEQRQRTKRHADGSTSPVWKDPAQTKPAYELVAHLLTMPTTTAPVGTVTDNRTPEEGEYVRLILAGGGYKQWIDAEDALGFKARVGDVVEQVVTYGMTYEGEGKPSGVQLTTQAQCDAVPRGVTMGYYGELTIRPADPSEAAWDAKACQFYNDANRPEAPAAPVHAPF
jgi:hypothetical protein